MQLIMLYIYTILRVTGGTQRVSLHDAMEPCGDMSELVLTRAQRCTSLEILISELQGSHVERISSASERFATLDEEL